MPQRLVIKRVEQYALDFGGNTLPIYIEDPPRDKEGKIPPDFVATMICPDCNQGRLIKGGAVGANNSVTYTCDYDICGFQWKKQDKMPGGIAIESL